jgi:hypothetical protein
MIASSSVFISRRWWMLQREWIVLHTTGPGAWTEALNIYETYSRNLGTLRSVQSLPSMLTFGGSKNTEQSEQSEQTEQEQILSIQEKQRIHYLLYLLSLDMKIQKKNSKLQLKQHLVNLDQQLSLETKLELQKTENIFHDREWMPISLRKLLLQEVETEFVIPIPSHYIAPAICTFFSNYRPCTVKSSFAIQLEGLSWVANKTTKNLTHFILELLFWLQIRNQKSLHNRVLRELKNFEVPKGLDVTQTQKQRIENGLKLFDQLTPKLENRALDTLRSLEKQLGNSINSWSNKIRRQLQLMKSTFALSGIHSKDETDDMTTMVIVCGGMVILILILVLVSVFLAISIFRKKS